MPSKPILIVDDDADQRELLGMALEPYRVPIVEADSGLAALTILYSARIGALVTDVNMGDESALQGDELVDLMLGISHDARKARFWQAVDGKPEELDWFVKRYAETPIVIVSAREQFAERYAPHGHVRFFSKPYDVMDLVGFLKGRGVLG
jgi:CheY-like chemotaxis protein